MDKESSRPNVEPRKVAAYIASLAGEGSRFHGELTIKYHGGKIVSVKTIESLNLYNFKVDEDN